jgi:WD40 repeat protein
MSKLCATLCLSLAAIVAQPLSAQPPAAESLPDGARLRLGTGALMPGEAVGAAAISRDGKYLAILGRDSLTLTERATGKRLAQIAGDGMSPGLSVAFAPIGNVLAYGGVPNLTIVEVPSGKQLHQLEVDEENARGMGLSFSADGKVVAIGMAGGGPKRTMRAYVWEVATGKHLATVAAAQNASCSTALSSDGKVMATWGRHVLRAIDDDPEPAQIAQLWDIAADKELRRLKIDRADTVIHNVAFSADGKSVFVAAGAASFHVFDTGTGKELRRFAGRRGLPLVLQHSPDGKTLVAGYFDGSVQAWDAGTGKRVALAAGPIAKTRVLSLAFPKEGEILALGMSGRALVWWDAVTGKASETRPGHAAPVLAVAFTTDGTTVRSASSDGTVLSWDAASGKLLRQTTLHDEQIVRGAPNPAALRVVGLGMSPDARYAATSTNYAPNNVRLWDLATGQGVCDFETSKPSTMIGLAFSARGDRLAAAGTARLINLWDAELGQDIGKVPYNTPGNAMVNTAPQVAVAPDGKLLALAQSYTDPATGMPAARVSIIDALSGKEVLEMPVATLGNQAGTGLAFSPDGGLLAMSGVNGGVRVVRAATGKEHRRLDSPAGAITAVAFSPDGRTVAAVRDGQVPFAVGMVVAEPAAVELWELASGGLRASYKGPAGAINCLAFSPDGLTLASGGVDTTVILWDVGGVAGQEPLTLTAGELDASWKTLAKSEGQTAFAAQRRLIASPAETVAFLKTQLRPVAVAKVDEKKAAQLVADLDSETFDVRDRANQALEKLGNLAEPALRKGRAGNISLEMRRRIDDLLDKLEHGIPTAEQLQAVRAVEVLERVGTSAARELLASLAEGAPSAVLTQDALRALRRMKK